MNERVREVRDGDADALIRLITACWSEYPGCVMDVDGEEPWLRAPATAYDAWNGRFWVVEHDGDVIACGGVKPRAATVVELKSLYVAKPARRKGTARRLLELIESEACRRGASRIELWSDTRFVDAHQFYLA